VAVENRLGTGVYSDEIQLMAVDPPLPPTITMDPVGRTLTSVSLLFSPNADTGGSRIVGSELWRDAGMAGSPFKRIYDGAYKAQTI